MTHKVYLPHFALSEFVDNIVISTFDFTIDTDISSLYTFVPTHTRFLCFFLEDKVLIKKNSEDFKLLSRAVIVGPHMAPVVLDLGTKHKHLVVNFKPSGLYRLLGLPLDKILNKDYDARLILGNEIGFVTEKLGSAKTDDQKNEIIQQYLISKLNSLKVALPFDMAMLDLVKNIGNLRVEAVAKNACLSLKQFERESIKRVGVSPKLYSKMIRFSNAYKLKELFPDRSWSSITHQCGYFDQMHLIKDFKFFTGITPSCLTKEDVLHSVRLRAIESVIL